MCASGVRAFECVHVLLGLVHACVLMCAHAFEWSSGWLRVRVPSHAVLDTHRPQMQASCAINNADAGAAGEGGELDVANE